MKYNKLLTFSFDDGVTQDIKFIEILNKYGLKATFNLNSELLGLSSSLTVSGETVSHNKVNKNDVKSIYQGHEVAAHTLTHPLLTQLSPEEITYQVENDRINLSNLVGYDVVGMAYPCGGVNANEYVADVIKNTTGIKYARTIQETSGYKGYENLFLFNPTFSLTKNTQTIAKIVDGFFDDNLSYPKLLYVWGHSYEFDAGDRWNVLEEFCQMVSGRNDVLYCTNKEAFEYLNLI